MSEQFSKGHSRRELTVGRLEGHGPAPYKFNRDEGPSYYLKVLTNRGRRILWGKDLARAMTESATQPKIGDLVGVQQAGVETFVFGDRVVRRNRWVVERIQFFADRARLARRVRDDHNDARAAVGARPELKSSFLSIRAAEDYAARRIADPQDRERFLEGIRSVINGSIVNKMPLPDVRMKVRPTSADPSRTPEPPPNRTRTR